MASVMLAAVPASPVGLHNDVNERDRRLGEAHGVFALRQSPCADRSCSARRADRQVAGLDRVKKIVQELKDFSRADQAEQWHGADLVTCLNSTLNIVNNEIKCESVVDKALVPLPEVQRLVQCPASQVDQVFLNLLVNAAQAVERDGRITLSCGHRATGEAGGEVWFDISDNGCGIAPENLARIFETLFATKTVGQGTGRGTRFRVVLPVRQTQVGRAATAVAAATADVGGA